MSVDDPAIEAALEAALGLSARGGTDVAIHHAPPMNPLAIGSALAAVAILFGLGFVELLPRPSTVAAAPVFIQADQADRQAVEARFEGLVTQLRLLRLGEERRDGEFGAKVFPVTPAALSKSRVFGLPEGER
jgi:hypothetical protein